MKLLRRLLDRTSVHFQEQGRLRRWQPLYDALDTFLYTPGTLTRHAPFIRDFLDIKRVMATVVIALLPAVMLGLYNTGLQASLRLSGLNPEVLGGWRIQWMSALGLTPDPANIAGNWILGVLYFLPIYLVTLAAGGFWEALFAIVRRHELAEGFFVTSLLFALIMPPTIPLWQVAVGISFGVVFGKEVFGGVGMNVLNPALTGRIFLFFAYPANMTGDTIWVAVDGVSQATLLSTPQTILSHGASWWDAFWGFIPGSIGETSTFACLLGAFFLILTGIASWRIMTGILAGMTALSLLFNLAVSSTTNVMFSIPPWWHLVLGGFAFGTVFMATDPVSAAVTEKGKWIYGGLIGCLVILIRVVNPAFPEGMMMAILFGNVFAPMIDRYFIQANIKRRRLRSGA